MRKPKGLLITAFLLAALVAQGQNASVPEVLILDDMEKDAAKNWQGGAPDTEHVKSAGHSVKWADHPKNPRLLAKHLEKDWSKYEALEFWMFSAIANDADTILIISSENPETEGIDYWSYKIKIDWAGWRHFRIPFQSLGRARNPIGWHEITGVYFTCSGWSCEPKPDTALWIDDVMLTREPVKLRLAHVERRRESGTFRCSLGVKSVSTQKRDFAISIAVPEDAPVKAAIEGDSTISLLPSEEKDVPLSVVMDLPAPGKEIVTVTVRTATEPELRAELSIPVGRLYFESIQPPPHPRLYVTPETLDQLRRRINEDPYAMETWARIKKTADQLADKYLKEGIPAKYKADIEAGRSLYGHAQELAFAYLITRDKKYADASRQAILATFQWDPWVFEFHRPMPADLGTGMVCQALGTAYDWIYDALSEEQRAEIRAGIMKRGMEPWWDFLRKGAGWGRAFRCNWLAVCCGGGAVCALSFLGEEPGAAEWLADAHWRIVSFLDEGGRDGGWPEGVGYWGYGMSYAALYGAALQTVTGGEANLFKHRYLQTTAQFPLYMVFPPSGCANFSDCGYHRPPSSLVAKLAAESQNPYAQWYVERYPRRDVHELLWYDPSLKPKDPSDLPQSIHFRGIDWAVFRSGWDGNETLFAMRGGNNGETHGMLECSDFVINSRGERLIINMGAPKYTHEYFSKQRWTFYRANSHGQNVVLIDDKDQLPGRQHQGQISGFVTTPAYDYLKCDLTGVWENLASKVVRHAAFIKPDHFIIFDEVECGEERSFDWRAHTATEPMIAGSRAGLVAGAAALEMRFLHPESLLLTAEKHEMSEPYLLARIPGKSRQGQFLTVIETRDAPQEAKSDFTNKALPPGVRWPTRVLLIMGGESEEWKKIAGLFESEGLICDHVGESKLAESLTGDPAALKSYAAIFLAPFKGGATVFKKEQMEALAAYVKNGGGLFVVGGADTFGEGGYDSTAIAEVLPIEIISRKDNIRNVKQQPKVVAEHEILRGIPKEWPAFGSSWGGYTNCRLRDGATMLLAAQPDVAGPDVPFVAIRDCEKGRAMIFGTMWAFGTGENFKRWPYAARFLRQSASWLSREPAQPIRCWLGGSAVSGISGVLSASLCVRNESDRPLANAIASVSDLKGREMALVGFDSIEPYGDASKSITVEIPPEAADDGLIVLSARGGEAAAFPIRLAKPAAGVEKIAGDGWLGAKLSNANGTWEVLFNLRKEPLSSGGIETDAESASVLRAGDRAAFCAVHQGKRLSVNGMVMIRSEGLLSCALKFDQNKICGQANMSDPGDISLHVGASPETIAAMANGKAAEVAWNREKNTATIRLNAGANDIRLEW